MEAKVMMDEIEKELESFKMDRSLGPDGWPVEFFLFFFDLVKQDLWKVVEQSQKEGRVGRDVNSTFMTLKCDKPSSFVDLRSISICNLIYKLISKVISNRIKPYWQGESPWSSSIP